MRPLRPLVLAALLLGSLVAIAPANATGPVGGTASVADRPDPFFGVITQRDMRSDDFDRMRWGRLGSFRHPVPWASVERTGDGTMSWESLDFVVGETASRGISLLPTLYGSPHWLFRDWRRLPLKTRYSTAKWKNFLRAIVARYGSRGTFWKENPDIPYRPVRRWQIWNEPNIKYFARPVSAAAYSKLLRVSSAVIKRRDPKARIVTAGLYGRPPRDTGIASNRFLRRMYRIRKTRKAFDVVAIHPYATTVRASVNRTRKVRRVIRSHRDGRTPLLITELGWGSDLESAFGLGSQEAQADRLRDAYRAFLARRRALRLQAIFWFSWTDLAPNADTCAFCRETGLFDYLGNPKLTWWRMLDFTHAV